MIIFKCGNCEKEFSVDEERISPNDEFRRCPNCGESMPCKVNLLVNRMISFSKSEENENWQIYRLPEKYSKAQVTLTLPIE